MAVIDKIRIGNKVYDIHEETKEHREASLEHMQKFINRFDEFETTFYGYIYSSSNGDWWLMHTSDIPTGAYFSLQGLILVAS